MLESVLDMFWGLRRTQLYVWTADHSERKEHMPKPGGGTVSEAKYTVRVEGRTSGCWKKFARDR